jgi:hypothetical protein
MTTQTHIESSFRELDYRETDGLEIWLVWSPATSALTVVVHDAKTQDVREFSVEPEHAGDAFRHPFAYLAELPEREPALNASPAA